MTLPFRTESEAAAELEEAAAWYEQQRFDLGGEFLEAVDDALGFIARWPHAGTPVPDVPPDLPVRRAPIRRFPYHVVYLEMPGAIRILASMVPTRLVLTRMVARFASGAAQSQASRNSLKKA